VRAVDQVPEAVRRKALALGADGERWLGGLDREVEELADEWGLTIGRALTGGSGGYVAGAVMAGGADVVVKIALPDGLEGNSPFATELETLRLGGGHGYVRVLRADERRRAMLLERLGAPLADLGLTVEAQIDAVASTLRLAWRPVPASTRLRTGAEQAEFLAGFIRRTWDGTGRPCPPSTVERATAFARRRRDAFDATTAVLVHGDAHPANVLQATADAAGGFKLIDPDGMVSEPAHDLAIPLRDWTDELLAADPVELGLRWCARLGERTGVAPQAIWEWAFVERVSTGLFLVHLGDPLGPRLLDVAGRWTAVQPGGSAS
jgi:streptomycin 6-kinase